MGLRGQERTCSLWRELQGQKWAEQKQQQQQQKACPLWRELQKQEEAQQQQVSSLWRELQGKKWQRLLPQVCHHQMLRKSFGTSRGGLGCRMPLPESDVSAGHAQEVTMTLWFMSRSGMAICSRWLSVPVGLVGL